VVSGQQCCGSSETVSKDFVAAAMAREMHDCVRRRVAKGMTD